METTTTVEKFEDETCSRCCGTGHYSSCASYGTKCFKCHGAKRVLTARGQAAEDYFLRLRSIPAREVVPGDRVWISGSPVRAALWVTVAESQGVRASSWVVGYRPGLAWRLTTTKGGNLEFEATAPVLVDHGPLAIAHLRAKALAYQATLTKKGTPRARARSSK